MRRFVAALLILSGLLVAGVADAGMTMSVTEVSGNATLTCGGSFNLSALSVTSTNTNLSRFLGWSGGESFAVGTPNGSVDNYTVSATNYSPASSQHIAISYTNITSSSPAAGSGCGIDIYDNATATLLFPYQYATNSSLSGTTTFSRSLAQLGMINGVYLWTFTNGSTSDTVTLTVSGSPPIVSAISPTSGTTAGNTSVTITGYNFTAATSVTIGGTAVTTFTVDSATQITATTAAHAVGSASVLVTTANGTNAANTLFTYVAPTYTIGGTITGLTGSGLVLTDTSAGSSTITTGATSFTLPTSLATSSSYAVSVQTQPTGQTCTVSNGSGSVASSNVTNVSVSCSSSPSTVPTLSEWTQILLTFLVMSAMVWYWNRERSY